MQVNQRFFREEVMYENDGLEKLIFNKMQKRTFQSPE